MKLTIFNAVLILSIGTVFLLIGVFLNAQGQDSANPMIFTGLAFIFLGTLWFVLSLYRRRKG